MSFYLSAGPIVAKTLLLEGFPQIKTRERTLGPPRRCQRLQIILIRQPRQSISSLDRTAYAQVADREHVRSSEVEHQEHICAPAAQALDGHDLLRDLVVRELVEAVQIQLPAMDAGCQVTEVPDLLPREPYLAQRVLFCGDELGRGRRALRRAR